MLLLIGEKALDVWAKGFFSQQAGQQPHAKSGLTTPFLVGDKAEGRRQKAEGKKDLIPKEGYQGRFGIN